MGFIEILILVCGVCYVLELVFKHREKMAQIKKDNGDK